MSNENTKYVVPTVTMNEHPDDYELTFELPGVGKTDVDLHVDGRTLTLKTHAAYAAPAGFKLAAQEFERQNYAVSVDLPELCDLATVSGAMEDGILRVTVRKRPETRARAIAIA